MNTISCWKNITFKFFAVLLTSNEFSLLGRLLTDYESREIPVEVFARELLKLISDEEKVRISQIKYRFRLPTPRL